MKRFCEFLVLFSAIFNLIVCNGNGENDKGDVGQDVQTGDNIPPQFGGLNSVISNFPDSVKLSWSAAKDNVTPENKITYIICVSEKEKECVDNFSERYSVVGTLSYQVTSLIEGKRYFFVVRAKDEAGNVDANTIEKSIEFAKPKDKTPPSFMGLLFANPSGPKSVNLLWNSASDNNTSQENITYLICMSEQQGKCATEFKEVYKSRPGANSYSIDNLVTGKTYYFVVRAVDEDGNMELNKEERSARPSADNRFVKTYGDATYRGASSFVVINDGFLLCGGGRVGDMLDSDIFISRLDTFGNVMWVKAFGGLRGDSCNSIVSSVDGTFYVAGSTQSFSQLGDKDLLFIKFSPNGEILFTKRIHSDKNDLHAQIATLPDGTIVYTGYTEVDNQKYDSFLILFDKDGNFIKKKYIHTVADDYVTRIKVFGDKIYLVGYTNPISDVNYDGFVLILDSELNIVNQKLIGGNDYDNFMALDIMDESKLLLAGQTKSFGDKEGDIYIVALELDKMDKSFAKVYSNENKRDSVGDIATIDDSIVVVGSMVPPIGGDDDGVFLRTDKQGNLLVKKYYRGIRDDWFTRLELCMDSICILGGTASMHNETPEVWLLKLMNDGTTGGECKISFINDFANMVAKDIEPVIKNGLFEIKDSDISVSDVVLNHVEVGAYTDVQCFAD
ncbi:MAG: fibronectin type III domain-containing protein [Deltaproteobacteria bacterium]|nr:fibronectin type III domain-containing protein [Deltaproteobacteria bacterium]